MDCIVKFAKRIAKKWERTQDAAKKTYYYVTETRLLVSQSLILKY